MDTSKLPTPKGMIVAGVMASEAIDSQGEKLVVRGADISDFLEGRGVANYEHRAADQEKIPASEVVGKIIDAHKVYGPKDCRNALEMEAWGKIEMPFIWGVVRLYDAAGHPGAVNLAAQIRDAHAHGDKVSIGFSIEGSTLERGKGNDKHILEQTVARRVAITFRPCNKTANLQLVADPKAPAGYEKMPGVAGLLPGETQKTEPGQYQRLGQGYENTYDLDTLEKALSAGGYNAAPGTLTGGAALQRESLRHQVAAAVRDWDKKTPFKKFLKHRLPDVDEGFLDQFSDMVHTHTLKKAATLLAKKLAEAKAPKTPKAPKAEKAPKVLPVVPKLTVRGQEVEPNPGIKNDVDSKFDEETGTLHTPRGSFKFYLPQHDKPEHAAAYENILKDPEITKYHDYALDNWMKIHEMAKAGKLPEELVAHGALFSELSPNTAVPVQELMYSHGVDAMREKGYDIRKPETHAALEQDWLERGKALNFPKHSPEHWKRLGEAVRIKSKKVTGTGRKYGDPQPFSMFPSKFANIAKYHTIHAPLVEAVNRHRGDARALTRELMDHKRAATLHEAMRQRLIAKGQPDPGPYLKGPSMQGLAPKTTRYMLGMLGHGNVHVPDTHFARFLFGLEKDKDTPAIEHIKDVLWHEQNAHVLEGIDRYFAKHHPAVKHLQEHPKHGQYFRENPEAAIFPAFWKSWMTVVPHEKARGMSTGGFATHTDHRPFFEYANSIMKAEDEHDLQPDDELPKRTARQHAEWAQQYGEMPAMMMYLRYLVPQLLAGAHRRAEKKVKTLAKVVNPVRLGADERVEPVQFQGKSVTPGRAVQGSTHYTLLGHTPTHWIGRVASNNHPKLQQGDTVQLPREDPSLTLMSHPLVHSDKPVVDIDRDGVGDLNPRAEQRALVHGMDLNPLRGAPYEGESAQGAMSYWHHGANGKRVFVKGGELGEARAEGQYNNLAHNFFGLGHYLPTVAAIRHPQTGAEIAVIQHVPGEHFRQTDPEHVQNLRTAHDSGDLHKIALMNYILGNHDRNPGHYLHRQGGGLALIDHGYSMNPDTGSDASPLPSYLKHHGTSHKEPLHPVAAKWLHGLNERDLEMEMKRVGVPPESIQASVQRLHNAKANHIRYPQDAFQDHRHMRNPEPVTVKP